ncbi:dihydrolipoyl dehydrogenase family protein [Arthrobacter pigmenti]
MPVTEDVVDLLVIGGGTAGIVGSQTAAGFGASTILVERARTGGDCLWTGCVPSKAILAAAKRAKLERDLTGRRPDFNAAREHVQNAIRSIEPDDSPETLERSGVTILTGEARFTGPGRADVDGRRIAFRQALIATGSEPAVPPIPGVEEAATVTSETIWDLEAAPGRLVVVGGGPVGCELAQAFARLGSAVTMLTRSNLLPKEDREAAGIIHRALQDDGVMVLEQTPAEAMEVHDGATQVEAGDGTRHAADVVLLATGRRPRSGHLGLEKVGVDCDASGHLIVDSKLRTTSPGIWAAGDVTGYPDFTHVAGVHASTAASNAILGVGRVVSDVVPRVTFTAPELAAVGPVTDTQLATSTVHHRDLDRAITEGRTEGITRLLLGKRGRILGGTIVSPRAGESIAEVALAVRKGLNTSDITGTTHPYPTFSDGVWNAAISNTRARLASPVGKTIIKTLVRLRRSILNRRQRR